jgi:UMF1 family MFS transporter
MILSKSCESFEKSYMSNQTSGKKSNLAAWSWAFYDWANSAFTTVIVTFVFATYVTSISGDKDVGAGQWSLMISISGLTIAILAPILGAVADHGGRRKPWLFAFTWTMAILTSALWWIKPEAGYVPMALVLIALANVCFELGVAFNNSMLVEVVEEDKLGRWSGWAWGLGYFGGLTILALCLGLFVFGDPASLGLNLEEKEEIRIIGPIVGVWTILFSLPLFLFTPDKKSTGVSIGTAVSEGLATLWRSIRDLRKKENRNIASFLLGRMLYADGLATLFVLGGVFAANAYGMAIEEVMQFGIIMNVTAGLGAIAFAWIDDHIGSKNTIIISVTAIIILGSLLLMFEDKTTFYIIAGALGIFVGPCQAASRTLMAKLAPVDMQAELFGIYAFSGKATAFMAPALVGLVTLMLGSQRLGMAVIPVFMLAGLFIIFFVKEPQKLRSSEEL